MDLHILYKSHSKYFGFPLSLPFYQRLPLSFFMLGLSEEQAGTWETTDKAILLKKNYFLSSQTAPARK
jgi:hypothetical protein